MTGFFIALLSGALMSVQGVFNTQVTKTTGMWVSNAWVQLSAFAICLVMWLIMGRDSIATIGEVQPKYMLLGGVIGAFITYTVIQGMSALGPAKATMLIPTSTGKSISIFFRMYFKSAICVPFKNSRTAFFRQSCQIHVLSA